MSISEKIKFYESELPSTVKLVAVSKFQPIEAIKEAYNSNQRVFGESRPQELMLKAESLPKDIEWHFIGHLQTNKLKMVLPFSTLIHSVDRESLLQSIEKYCSANSLRVDVLLQLYIAKEESKQGFSKEELLTLLEQIDAGAFVLENVTIRGLMGMATYTEDMQTVRREFGELTDTFNHIKSLSYPFLSKFDQLSFGMANDYKVAVEMGATYIRIGTDIFGGRG